MDTFERKLDIQAFTGTWTTEVDDRETHNEKDYQPIEANHRKTSKRRSSVIAVF